MQTLDAIDLPRIDALLGAGEFLWLDLHDPSPAELHELADRLGWHPLLLEDLEHFDQRPKLDAYGDHMLLVFYGARLGPGEEPGVTEVHTVVSGEWIVTVHREPSPELDALHDRFERAPASSEQWVVYRILDTLTDTFFPVLEWMDDRIDDLEDAIVQSPDDEQLQRVFRLKRHLVTFRRVVTPQRDLAARAMDEIASLPGLEPGSRDYFRDVYDHLIRISDLIDSYRDLLTGIMDVYLSTVSNRLNAIMKSLTVIATVFLPLTFVTGFFGQNFGWMVRHVNTFGDFLLYGIGGCVLAIGLLAWFFRRRGFI